MVNFDSQMAEITIITFNHSLQISHFCDCQGVNKVTKRNSTELCRMFGSE